MRRTIFVIVACGSLATLESPAGARNWTSDDGKYSIKADLVEVAGETAKLKKPDGEVVSVPIARLSAADRRFLAISGKEEVSYVRNVQPFLDKYCVACHKQDKAKAGYNVQSFAELMRGGKKGALVAPGKPDESRLMLTLHGKGKPMPPRKSPQPTAKEIAKVSAWIQAGAKDDSAAK